MAGMSQMMMGAGSGVQVNLIGYSANIFGIAGATRTAGYRILSTGLEQRTQSNNSYSGTNLVVDPVSRLSDYEVLMTLDSGNSPSGIVGAWQSLGTTRTWSLSRSTVGGSSCSMTIQIRKIGTTQILDTATVSLSVTIET